MLRIKNGVETVAAIIGATAAVAGTATSVVSAVRRPKAPAPPKKSTLQSPAVPEDKKSPLQRGGLIQTGPAGLTDEPTLGRNKLLGN